MTQIHFYATPSDIKPVLDRFEANAALQYARHGKRSELKWKVYASYLDIPDVGLASHGTGSSSPSYAVLLRGTQYVVSTFLNDDGEQRWLLINGDNKDSVSLQVAGLWKTGTLLPGVMSTLHGTQMARKLMRWFLQALKEEHFRLIGPYWLGTEALDMVRSGKRLTIAEHAPPEFDFRLPDNLR